MYVNMGSGEGGPNPTNNSEQNLNSAPPRGPRPLPGGPGSPRVATGPRTMQGKERSKHNALKHGIFSKVALLKGESKTEFDSFLDGLRADYQPEGTLEDVLVEKLATVLWRQRRLLAAEGAEVQSKVEFLQWDQQTRQFDELEQMEDSNPSAPTPGLPRKIENPDVRRLRLTWLSKLREVIARNGFDKQRDAELLREIYRFSGGNLYRDYSQCLRAAQVPEDRRESEGLATPEECVKNFIRVMDTEISWLRRYPEERRTFEASRAKLEALRQNVPDSPTLDRLLRYEASLERSFDRTLKQLERLQKIRLGLAVPPSVDVNISS